MAKRTTSRISTAAERSPAAAARPETEASREAPIGTVAVLADDLIWASRLVMAVERAGARAVRLASESELDTVLRADALSELGPEQVSRRIVGVIVDMTARRYDAPASVARATRAGKAVIAVAQHDDQLIRRRALDAGAQRVFAYGKLFTDGPAVIERWLGRLTTGTPGATAPPVGALSSKT